MSDKESNSPPATKLSGKRGGKRPGAGRPKGATRKRKSMERALDMVTDGRATPIEVMIEAMRHEYELQRRLPFDKRDFSKASDLAAKAAPYCHPRLSAIAHQPLPEDPLHEKTVPFLEIARRYAYLLRAAENEIIEGDSEEVVTH